MSEFSHQRRLAWLITLAAALILSACATTTPEAEVEAPAEKTYEFEPWEGDGLQIPLDGSSMEAWETSMARVKAHTTEKQFITLENSIDYLLMYDLKAERDLGKLIGRLDGYTGYDIINQIQWRKPAPGKGPAEKGAADAKIIDS